MFLYTSSEKLSETELAIASTAATVAVAAEVQGHFVYRGIVGLCVRQCVHICL